MTTEQFSLCWDNFQKNLSSGINALLENEDLVDVTLAVEGRYLKAHKLILSICSPYFRNLFKSNPCKHPIVFMKDVSFVALHDLLQFMYHGEVQVSQENLTTFIKTAEALQIKGLTGDENAPDDAEERKVALSTDFNAINTVPTNPNTTLTTTPLTNKKKVSSPNTTSFKRQRLNPLNIAAFQPETNIIEFPSKIKTQSIDHVIEERLNTANPVKELLGENEEAQAGTSARSDGNYTKEGQGVVYFNRGKKHPILVFNNFEYKVIRQLPNRSRWACTCMNRNRCRAKIVTFGKTLEINYEFHTHPPTYAGNLDNLKSQTVQVFVKKRMIYFDIAMKNPKIIVEGHDYLIYRKLPDRTVWLCCQYYSSTTAGRCKVRITTKGREAIIDGQHSHLPKVSPVHYMRMMSQIVNIIRKYPNNSF